MVLENKHMRKYMEHKKNVKILMKTILNHMKLDKADQMKQIR